MLQPETFYHIYNCANGSENLFREDQNYYFFLSKWAKYIEPVADTYAYCLMPNHFHFLIRTKSRAAVEQTFGKFETFQKLSFRYSKQFANLFSSYTQAYNKLYERRGSLFNPNFKAKSIESDGYLTNIIHYIHHNPIHHGFSNRVEEWPYSSYQSILSSKPTRLKRELVAQWFGNKATFMQMHRNGRLSLDELEKTFTTL